MKTVAFCEIDPFCQKVLHKHWPDVPIYGDIRILTKSQLEKDGIKKIDVICGGFPCQDISVAGKGAGITGSRSGLWKEYARLISEIQPKYVIIENVAALRGRGLSIVLQDLAKIGYNAEWDTIPATAVGANHRRERVYILAYHRGKRIERLMPREIQRQPEFSWSKDVRRLENLPERSPLYESRLCRSANGISKRLDSIGNAVVPAIPRLLGFNLYNVGYMWGGDA